MVNEGQLKIGLVKFIEKNIDFIIQRQHIQIKNNKKEMNYSHTIINKYLNQQFLPHLWEVLRLKQIEKKVEKHMPYVISQHMVIGLLDSTAKNNNFLKKMKNKYELAQVPQNKKDMDNIKLRTRKNSKKIQSTFIKIQQNDYQQKIEERSVASTKNRNSSLIKLPSAQQEQSQQVINIRKLKERMRRFQKQIKQRQQQNAYLNKQSARKKKSVHSQCKYHTYDYSADIIPVDFESYIQNQEKEQSSLLQCLKQNLDKQIQDQTLAKKLQQINLRNKNLNVNILQHKIQKVQTNNEPKPRKQANKSQQSTFLKPLYKFQLSNIYSLSKQFENYIKEGVKLVTNQQRIVQQTQNPEGPRYIVKKQKLIHEKSSSQKQKTLSSQSIIYSLQKNLKNSIIREDNSVESNKISKKYQSLQLDREQQQSKLSQYLVNNNNKQIKSTRNTPAQYDFKLPSIRFNRQGRRLPKKRTATQQKMIKGLDHIEIQVKSPHKNEQKPASERSGLFSAFSLNKKTESSIQQYEVDKMSVGGKKKTFIQDYFNNYGSQFRHKRGLLNQGVMNNHE